MADRLDMATGELIPDDEILQSQFPEILADMERYGDALKSVERAFRCMSPEDEWLTEDLYYEKAAILDAIGRQDEALATYDTVGAASADLRAEYDDARTVYGTCAGDAGMKVRLERCWRGCRGTSRSCRRASRRSSSAAATRAACERARCRTRASGST